MPESSTGRRRLKILSVFLVLLCVFAGAVAYTYRTVPKRDTTLGPVDVLLVLGSPTELDGSLSDEERWRVDEAVREYRAGRSDHILMSGGAVANRFVEAHAMAQYAVRLSVPASAVLEEGTSRNTLENVQNSVPILEAHGWRRVEVISSGEHLPRAALLLKRTPLLWQTDPAPTPGRSRIEEAGAYAEEAVGTALIRWFGLRILPVLHVFAVMQHGTGWTLRWVKYFLEAHLVRR